MSNKYLGRGTLRLCQYPVSQRPIPRCGISASPLQPLSPGSSYSKFLLSLFCVYYLEFLRGNSFYFLLYLFLMVYFYQHAPMDIYFILWVVAIEASALSCCSICSSFGPWKCSQVASCVLSVEHPLLFLSLRLEYFPGPGTTQCSCSSCASLAPILEASMSPGDCSSVLWFIGKWYLWCKYPA